MYFDPGVYCLLKERLSKIADTNLLGGKMIQPSGMVAMQFYGFII